MRSTRTLGGCLATAGLLLASASSSLAAQAPEAAAAPPSADAPMATSRSGPQVADQIQAFINSSPAAEKRRSSLRDYDDDLPAPDRQVHGEVSVGVGNHGYRSAYARSDIPVGKRGTVSIAVGEERGRGFGYGAPYGGYGDPYGMGRRQSLGLGFDWSGSPRPACRGADAADPRCAPVDRTD